MNILFFIIGWIIGLFVASFTLIQILIILFFGFPTTRKLEQLDMINKDNGIIGRYCISLIIISVIFLGITYIIYIFFTQLLSGFIIGGILVIIFGIGKVGANPDNIKDYLVSNSKYFKASGDEIFGAITRK